MATTGYGPDGVRYGPKKASTSYFMFTAAVREQVKKENPGVSTTELTKLLGAQWRALSDKEKVPFEKQAEVDRLRYQKEFQRWVAEHPEEVELVQATKKEKKQGKKRSMKQEGGPKRACTAYIFFTNSVREKTQKEAPDAKMTELSKLMGAKWQALSDSQKAPFVAKADKDKERYEKEKANWLKEMAEAQRAAKIKELGEKIAAQQLRSGSLPGPPTIEQLTALLERLQSLVADDLLTKEESFGVDDVLAMFKGRKRTALCETLRQMVDLSVGVAADRRFAEQLREQFFSAPA